MILFFDTETTGFVNRSKPLSDPCQPYIVQLAAIATDDDGNELSCINFIIEPKGYVIPDVVAKIHGISQDIAMVNGIDIVAAMYAFIKMREKASLIVAHNLEFDRDVIDIAEMRMPVRDYPKWPKASFCTMEASRDIVNLPPTQAMLKSGRNHPKTPNLTETYRFFFEKDFLGAHNALNDVRACRDVYFALKERNDGQA